MICCISTLSLLALGLCVFIVVFLLSALRWFGHIERISGLVRVSGLVAAEQMRCQVQLAEVLLMTKTLQSIKLQGMDIMRAHEKVEFVKQQAKQNREEVDGFHRHILNAAVQC